MFNGLRTLLDQASAFELAIAIPYAIAIGAVTAEVIWRARSADASSVRHARAPP